MQIDSPGHIDYGDGSLPPFFQHCPPTYGAVGSASTKPVPPKMICRKSGRRNVPPRESPAVRKLKYGIYSNLSAKVRRTLLRRLEREQQEQRAMVEADKNANRANSDFKE